MARTSNKTAKQEEATPSPRSVPWGGIITAVVVVGAIGGLILFDRPPPGVQFPDQGNFHIPTIDSPHAGYNSSPPSSGPHFAGLANWGVAEEAIPPEVFVHNLEDAGIVLAYDCPDGCDDLSSGLADFVEETSGRLVLTPYRGIEYQGQSYRAAAVAWTRVFFFDELTEENLDELEVFVNIYEGIDHHVGS